MNPLLSWKVITLFFQALSSKYFQVGQNLNTSSQPATTARASQPTTIAHPSQPVAPPLRSRPSVTNINHKFSGTSLGSGNSKYVDTRQPDSKEVLIQKKESKDNWSVESVSPAPNMAAAPSLKKRSDWKAPRHSLHDDRMPWEGQKSTLGSIRESPGEIHPGGRKSEAVTSKRTQDLADLDSILSEFDNTSVKKERYVYRDYMLVGGQILHAYSNWQNTGLT